MEERIEKMINKYEGETNGLETITVKKGVGDYSWNKHLFVPLENNQKVFIHPSQEGVGENFIRIIHSDYKCVAVFSRLHFDF